MSDQYPIVDIPDDTYPPPDQLLTDIPDSMYLPPDLFPMGEILPVFEKKLVLADKNEFIKCQWAGCGGEFQGTIPEMQKHFKEKHLKESIEKAKQKTKEIMDEVVYGRLTDAQAKQAIKKVKVAECWWKVNDRVPCREVRSLGYGGHVPKPFNLPMIDKHISSHISSEGLPNPFVKESECCGHLYLIYRAKRGEPIHKKDCEYALSKKPEKKKRKLNPEDEDEEEYVP